MLTFNVLGNNIVGSMPGSTFSVEYTEDRFNSMMSLLNDLREAKSMDEATRIIEKFKDLTVISPKESIESAIPDILFEESTGRFFLKTSRVDKGRTVTIKSKIPMPKSLTDRIFEALDKGHSVEPFLKFWKRLLRNPVVREEGEMNILAKLVCNYISRTYVDSNLFDQFLDQGYSEEVATEMATVHQTPMTTEGLIVTKKVVAPVLNTITHMYIIDEHGNKKIVRRDGFEDQVDPETGEVSNTVEEAQNNSFSEDWIYKPYIWSGGDKFYCGDKIGYIYRVGKEARLESWDQVNCNSNQSCSKGLHTGNQDYINSYERDSNVTLNCFVDPSQIGAVPDGEDVFRVKSLFPHSIKNRELSNKQLYFSSDYASLKDTEWDKMRTEAVERWAEELKVIEDTYNTETQRVEDEVSELKNL